MLIQSNEFEWFENDNEELTQGSYDQLSKAVEAGIVFENRVRIIGRDDWTNFEQIKKIDVGFSPSIKDIARSRQNKLTTIFSGANNSGKSLTLKYLYRLYGNKALLVGVNRFYNLDRISSGNETNTSSFYPRHLQQLYTRDINTENNYLNFEHILYSLSDNDFSILWDICGDLLDTSFVLEPVRPGYRFSGWQIKMGNEKLSVGSTGTRLLLSLVGVMLMKDIEILLIDEPELGLSPRIEAALAKYIHDTDLRKGYFPHLKQIYIATHSHIFLNRSVHDDNFTVSKEGGLISIEQVKSVADLHHLQFSMLGNELQTLFLPSAIIIVEGPTDRDYLSKVLQLYIPEKRITVARSDGDSVAKQINMLNEMLGDLQVSPYKNRVFVVLDKNYSVKLQRLINNGVANDNIQSWTRNGIEYYYPHNLLGDVFGCSPDEVVERMEVADNFVTVNTIHKSKKELCSIIVTKMTLDSLRYIPQELTDFLNKVRDMI